MWKVKIICDSCSFATPEGTAQSCNDARNAAKRAALEAGWNYTRNIGWHCPRCHNKTRVLVGQRVRYIGQLIGADLCSLKGSCAQVLERRGYIVHAIFEDPEVAGRYSQQAHWFFEHEFEPITEEKADGSNTGQINHQPGSTNDSQLVGDG